MTRRVGSRQSAKERATTKPLVLVMNQDFSLSSGGGTSARSPDGNESCTGEDEIEEGKEGEGVEVGTCTDGEGSGSDGDQGDGDEETGDNRPFILPEDWP